MGYHQQSRREKDKEYFDSLKRQQEETSKLEDPFDMDERLALGDLMQDDDARNIAAESYDLIYCTKERHDIDQTY